MSLWNILRDAYISRAGVVLTGMHYETHEGNAFTACHRFAVLANNASAEMLIKVGSTNELHMLPGVLAGGDCHVDLYEAPTNDDVGTAVTAVNRKRSSGTTSDATITHTPNITGDGTAIAPTFLPGGTGPLSPGGSVEERDEWILKTSTDYLLRVTNKSGGNVDLSIALRWYELVE